MSYEAVQKAETVKTLMSAVSITDALLHGAEWHAERLPAASGSDEREAFDRVKEVARLFSQTGNRVRKGHASPRDAFLAVSNYKSQFGHDPQEGPIEQLMTTHLEKVLAVVRFTLAGISQWEGGVE